MRIVFIFPQIFRGAADRTHADLNTRVADASHVQVSYREAITGRAEIDYTHKKQSGGSGQFARVKISVRLPLLFLVILS